MKHLYIHMLLISVFFRVCFDHIVLWLNACTSENCPPCYFQYEYRASDICLRFITSRWLEIVHHRCPIQPSSVSLRAKSRSAWVSVVFLVPKYCEFMYNWLAKSSLNGNSFRMDTTCQFFSHNHSAKYTFSFLQGIIKEESRTPAWILMSSDLGGIKSKLFHIVNHLSAAVCVTASIKTL